MTRINRLETALSVLNPAQLEIFDDSHHHAGHAAMKGIKGEETHLRIEIASAEFANKSRIQAHRMVQNCCKAEMQTGLHALQIKILSVEQ